MNFTGKKFVERVIAITLSTAIINTVVLYSTQTVFARDHFDEGERENYFDNHTVGIVGAMTGWSWGHDVPMTNPDGDGIYVGIYKNLAKGRYEFKVRADEAWDDSWGAYEIDYNRTLNSQTNFSIDVEYCTDLIVMLDTNGDDETIWPVTYYSTEKFEPSRYGLVGSMTGWGEIADVPMYEVDGKYYGMFKDLSAGEYEFKVRADNDWAESYGVYEEDYDRTNNSQTNIAVTLYGISDIIVELDTTGDDDIIWPVSYTIITDGKIVEETYTGKQMKIDYANITFRSDTSENMKSSHSFYYSDNLFGQKSTVFNQKLAILTLGMVMSGFSSGESDKYWSVGRDTTNDETAIKTAEKSRVENISHTYNLLGFDKSSIEYYNYDVSLNDASDKVAFSIASKKIHVNGANKTLVAVILRGGGYGSEWSSNFNMGSNGLYHEAFNNAAWEVADKVIDYLGRKKLTQNVKILMGGFSRAAATANLATAKLDKLSNSNKLYSISRDDIYTYTFATPQGIVDNKQNDIHNSLYNNIFNIVNPTDIVPTVALSKWGFGRYGISLTLPYVTAKSSKAANVTKKYNQLTHQKADILQAFKVYKSGINDMDDILYKIAQNTDIFVEEKYQAVITKVLQFLYYDNNASKSVLTLQDIEKAIKNIYPNDYEMIFTNLYIYTTSSIITDLVNPESKLMIATILSIIDVETGSPERFTKDTIKKLPIAEILLCGVIVPFGNLMSSDFVSFLISISSRIDYVSKVVDSVLNVGFNHYPELYLSWLESYEAKELFGKKTYKKITASCPVNIDVYSDNGELLASIVNNEIIKDEIPIYLENDSKEIWLTDGDKYDIKITAYDNGTMTYSIEEYDQDFEMQNKTNFYDVPLKKDKVFETAVSSSVGESVTLYDKGSKKIIHPSETLTKDDEEIEISVSCDSNGHVYGNQNVVKGEYVSVTAVPNDEYVFKGWFKENKLVSKDLEYYFNAIENVNLVAKFEKVQFIVGDTNSDGNADIADALMVARYDAGLIQLDENQCSVSDVNQDDIVDIADALMIARYDAGLINSLI